MDTPEPYWSSSETCDLVEYAYDEGKGGKQWDLERLIDWSTIKIKLAQLLWVSWALALVGICSCDLFDLNRIHCSWFSCKHSVSVFGSDITDSNLPL